MHKPLIDAADLLRIMDRPATRVFDVRGTWSDTPAEAHSRYLQGHIPGAVFLDWKTHFLKPVDKLNLAAVCDYDGARHAFKALGIQPDDTVVLYDDYHHMFASRIWWAMRYWGFEDVRVLNGGWQHWQARAFPTSMLEVTRAGGAFEPSGRAELIATLDDVIARPDDAVLVDARSADGYNGTTQDDRTGHIPGAINLPFRDLLDDDTGLFKSTRDLAHYFSRHVPNWRDATILSSCGSGYAGAVTLVALKTLGINAPLYDGSFAEYKQDRARIIHSVRDRSRH